MSKVTEEGALVGEESCILKDTWVSDVTCTKKPVIFSRSHRYNHLLNDKLSWEREIMLMLIFMEKNYKVAEIL